MGWIIEFLCAMTIITNSKIIFYVFSTANAIKATAGNTFIFIILLTCANKLFILLLTYAIIKLLSLNVV